MAYKWTPFFFIILLFQNFGLYLARFRKLLWLPSGTMWISRDQFQTTYVQSNHPTHSTMPPAHNGEHTDKWMIEVSREGSGKFPFLGCHHFPYFI